MSVHTALGPRFKGRQFSVGTSKLTKDGVFQRAEYKSEPYQPTVPYLKREPLAQRKNGFGSRSPSMRDEFTAYIRTQQYREQLKSEFLATGQISPKASTSSTTSATAVFEGSGWTYNGRPIGATQPAEVRIGGRRIHQYDRAHAADADTADSLDPRRSLQRARKSGALPRYGDEWTTSSSEVGRGIDSVPCEKPRFAVASSMKQLFDIGHIS